MITEECDKKRDQDVEPRLVRTDTRDGDNDVSTGFANAPHGIVAQQLVRTQLPDPIVHVFVCVHVFV